MVPGVGGRQAMNDTRRYSRRGAFARNRRHRYTHVLRRVPVRRVFKGTSNGIACEHKMNGKERIPRTVATVVRLEPTSVVRRTTGTDTSPDRPRYIPLSTLRKQRHLTTPLKPDAAVSTPCHHLLRPRWTMTCIVCRTAIPRIWYCSAMKVE